MLLYSRKNTLRNFHGYFHMLGTFNTKLILKIQNCMKSNRGKFLKYFSNIEYHVTSYLTKFDFKTQFVHGDKKEEKFFIKGRLDQLI